MNRKVGKFMHVVNINGINYVFSFKEKLRVFKYKNGNFVPIDLNTLKDDSVLLERSIDEIMGNVSSKIANNIENGKYKNLEEMTEDINREIGKIDVSELKEVLKTLNFTNLQSYKDTLKWLSDKFSATMNNLQDKKEIVKQKTENDLENLFKQNGISEYEINPTSSVIVYIKNGVPYTFNHSDPNSNVYDTIFDTLKVEDLNNKESIEKGINDAMELQGEYKYSANRTVRESEMNNETFSLNEITDTLKREFGINELYGSIRPVIDQSGPVAGAFLFDRGNGWEQFFVVREPNGSLKITLGKSKEVYNVETNQNSVERVDVEMKETDTLQNQNIDYQMIDGMFRQMIYKMENGIELSEDELNMIAYYNHPNILNTLPQDLKETVQTVSHMSEDKLTADFEKRDNINNSVKRIGSIQANQNNNLPKAAFIDPGLAIFLSGVLVGVTTIFVASILS